MYVWRLTQFVINERGEMVGYLNMYSNWLIYQGCKGTSFKPTSYREIEKNVERELTDFEKNRIEELRDWSYNFFQTYRLKFITWWTPLREPADEEKAIHDDELTESVDLILKVESVHEDTATIKFIDHAGKLYGLYQRCNRQMVKGEVVYFMRVDV
jgi:hypothetical protein